MTKIINIFGGAGAGKSTVAAGLFYEMKIRQIDVELVTEFAKDIYWSERTHMFTEQDYILANQNHRIRRLNGKVDWVITDSPLILGLFYMPEDYPGRDSFRKFLCDMYDSYDNINLFLDREHAYNPKGRVQTEEESVVIHNDIKQFLIENDIKHTNFVANEQTKDDIFKFITK